MSDDAAGLLLGSDELQLQPNKPRGPSLFSQRRSAKARKKQVWKVEKKERKAHDKRPLHPKALSQLTGTDTEAVEKAENKTSRRAAAREVGKAVQRGELEGTSLYRPQRALTKDDTDCAISHTDHISDFAIGRLFALERQSLQQFLKGEWAPPRSGHGDLLKDRDKLGQWTKWEKLSPEEKKAEYLRLKQRFENRPPKLTNKDKKEKRRLAAAVRAAEVVDDDAVTVSGRQGDRVDAREQLGSEMAKVGDDNLADWEISDHEEGGVSLDGMKSAMEELDKVDDWALGVVGDAAMAVPGQGAWCEGRQLVLRGRNA